MRAGELNKKLTFEWLCFAGKKTVFVNLFQFANLYKTIFYSLNVQNSSSNDIFTEPRNEFAEPGLKNTAVKAYFLLL